MDEKQRMEAARELAAFLAQSNSTVAFTGAGISTESGIPDFRSPSGVWATNRQIYFDEFCSSAEARSEYWRQKSIAHRDFADARPNITHHMLAEWEAAGSLRGILTQNIDGLHQAAGNQNVLEIHGTARDVACLECSWRDRADQWVDAFLAENVVPVCPECQGIIKHATVSFGQSLPAAVMQKSAQWARDADLFIVLGTSLVVEPAASLPRLAREHGARLVILNRDPTPQDRTADLVVNASLGEFFTSFKEVDR